MSEITIKRVKGLDFARVKQIYVGRDRVCRCGCKGSYEEDRTSVRFKRRVAMFKRLCEKIDTSEVVVTGDTDGTYINVSYGDDRTLALYFDEAPGATAGKK